MVDGLVPIDRFPTVRRWISRPQNSAEFSSDRRCGEARVWSDWTAGRSWGNCGSRSQTWDAKFVLKLGRKVCVKAAKNAQNARDEHIYGLWWFMDRQGNFCSMCAKTLKIHGMNSYGLWSSTRMGSILPNGYRVTSLWIDGHQPMAGYFFIQMANSYLGASPGLQCAVICLLQTISPSNYKPMFLPTQQSY